jgi:O-antigen/teichoic acid export membrane protein
MAAVAFLGSIVLARALGPGGYGSFYLLMAIVAFLDNPLTGWASACRKRLTETDFPSGETIGSLVLGIVLSSLAVVVLSILGAPLVASLTGLADGWLLLAVLFVGMVSYHAANEVLKSTSRFGAGPWLEASRDVLRVGAQILLVLAGFGVAGMVGGMVVANLLVAPVVFYLIDATPRTPSWQSLQRIWDYARYSIPGGVVGTAQHRMDLILLGVLATTSVVGVYEIALKLTIPAMFVAGVAQNGLMGRISNLRSRDVSVATDVRRNIGNASIIGFPLFFGALVLAEPVVVTIYSNQYAAAAPFLVGLSLFRLLRTQKSIFIATINGFDRPDLNLRISTVVFAFNLVTGVALFVAIGPMGIVVATVVSELIGYLARVSIVRSLVPSVTIAPRPLLDQAASGVVMAVVVYAARVVVPLGSWESVVLLVALGGLVYGVTLVSISTHFRQTVRAIAADAGV